MVKVQLFCCPENFQFSDNFLYNGKKLYESRVQLLCCSRCWYCTKHINMVLRNGINYEKNSNCEENVMNCEENSIHCKENSINCEENSVKRAQESVMGSQSLCFF